MVIVLKPEYTNEEAKTIRAQLFADTKEEVTSNMTVVGLKEGYTLDVASSVTTPSGIGYLKSNGEWAFVTQSGGGSGGGGSSMQYMTVATATGDGSTTYQQILESLCEQVYEANLSIEALYMSRLIIEGFEYAEGNLSIPVRTALKSTFEELDFVGLTFVSAYTEPSASQYINNVIDTFTLAYVSDTGTHGTEYNKFVHAYTSGNSQGTASYSYDRSENTTANKSFSIVTIVDTSSNSSGA